MREGEITARNVAQMIARHNRYDRVITYQQFLAIFTDMQAKGELETWGVSLVRFTAMVLWWRTRDNEHFCTNNA